MRLLLSAYACMPGVGSEPGVGWRWALHLARSHEVVVITHRRFRAAIEAHVGAHPGVAYPQFHYHDTPLLSAVPFNGATALPKYFVWQFTVMPLARRLMREFRFDLAVHITMCTFRYPSWMGYLGAPFVIGPVGGGEAAPRALLAGLPLFERAFEALRSLLIASAKIDPLLWLSQRKAALVMTRSTQTSAALPAGIGAKARLFLDIGSDSPAAGVARQRRPGEPLRLIMVTRLLGWKGVHLAIETLAECRRRGLLLTLEIVGDGRLRGWLEALAQRLDVAAQLSFTGQLPQREVMARLAAADALLFPSLHDSGGMAVLEAMACGLPTICLDLGGPAITVTPECGIVVSTAGADQAAVVARLADAVAALERDEALRLAMGQAALARARELSWDRSLAEGQFLLEAQIPGGAVHV
jgi:glycosyltransferase involved in cell wall biosynthesis